jgi:hypothetical protein
MSVGDTSVAAESAPEEADTGLGVLQELVETPPPPPPPAAQPPPPEPTDPAADLQRFLALQGEPNFSAKDQWRESLKGIGSAVEQYRSLGAAARAEMWVPLYSSALSLCAPMVQAIDRKAAFLESTAPTEAQINELLYVAGGTARKEATEAANRIKGDLRAAHDEWNDRIHRQAANQMMEECVKQGRSSVAVRKEDDPPYREFNVDRTWLETYKKFLTDACIRWTDHSTQGSDQSFQQAAAQAASVPIARGRGVNIKERPLPSAEIGFVNTPEPQERFRIKGPWELGWGDLVTNGLFVVGIIAAAALILGLFLGVSNLWIPILVLLVLGGGLAWFVVSHGRRVQQKVLADADRNFDSAARGWVARVAEANVKRHEQRMEQWLESRHKDWEQALGIWWSGSVETELRAAEQSAGQQVTILRKKRNDQLTEARALRSLQQKINARSTELSARKKELEALATRR